MQLRPEQLEAHLGKGLRPLYTVHGDEPLLAQEAADAIRAAARAAGYAERKVFTVSGNHFDWSGVLGAAQAMSLFADRQLIEIRIPSGKPGKDGSDALQRYCEQLGEDVLTLVQLPRLDFQQMKAAWFTALDTAGITLRVEPVERRALPQWLAQRLARRLCSKCKEPHVATEEELNLAETGTSNDELECLGKLGQLRSLILCATEVGDSGLPHLANLTQLEYLNLGGNNVTDDGLPQLHSLKSLRKLDLRQTKVTDAGLVRLQGLPALEEIDLDVRVMTDVGLQNYLTVVRKPRKLLLQNTAVTDAGLAHLLDCPDLEFLNLETTKVSRLPQLSQLTNLTYLNLCHTCLSLAGFDQLALMQNLLTLDLSNLQVKHPLDSLLNLKSLTSLGTLQIYSWSLEPDEIEELRQALPNCKIQH